MLSLDPAVLTRIDPNGREKRKQERIRSASHVKNKKHRRSVANALAIVQELKIEVPAQGFVSKRKK